MSEEARRVVAEVLAAGEVDGVLSLRVADGAVGPHYYKEGDDLDDLVLSPKYALPLVLRWFHQHSPGTKLKGSLYRIGKSALTAALPDYQPVYHRLNRVLLELIKLNLL